MRSRPNKAELCLCNEALLHHIGARSLAKQEQIQVHSYKMNALSSSQAKTETNKQVHSYKMNALSSSHGETGQRKFIKRKKRYSNMVEETKDELNKILLELRTKMSEIDELTQELKDKREELEKVSPKKTKKLLEEIRVPPLEMLK